MAKGNKKVKCSSWEEMATVNGFSSGLEMSRMIASPDLSSPLIMRLFETWKENDGSKKGLQKIIDLGVNVTLRV